MTKPIVFTDCETTHLHPDLRVPWEIAMIRRPARLIEDRVTIMISDVDLSYADPQSLKVGRFHERYPRTKLHNGAMLGENTYWFNEKTAAEIVEEWTRDAFVVGCVTDFDASTYDRMLRRHGLMPGWHYHLGEVENLAVGWLRGAMAHGLEVDETLLAPPWKSDELSRALGVELPTEEERHTAMGDTRWAERIWDRVMGTAPTAKAA